MVKEARLLRHIGEKCRKLLDAAGGEGLAEAIRRTSPEGYADTRLVAYALADLLLVWIHRDSACHPEGDDREALRRLIESGLAYLERERRESGCFDLSSCNFDSAPDTAFPVIELMDAWELLPREDPFSGRLLDIIRRACEGVSAGGFHTPNHRWVIAACLLQAAKITGRQDFARRADTYLGEGLDISSEGEFAERSTGIYNAVNDEKMLRLYLLTGDEQYLRAARANLTLMLRYLEPDGSLFTPHSTRQDRGTTVWAGRYWLLFLLTGYLMRDPGFAALSRPMWEASVSRGETPGGLSWLMRYPEMEAFGEQAEPEDISRFSAVLPQSGIGRWRRGRMTCTALSGHADFLYITSGSANVRISLYCNVCDRRNFIPERVEETPEGCRLTAALPSWYYLPFEGDGPATRDWWAMDNPATRRRQIRAVLTVTAEIAVGEDSVTLRLKTEGLDRVPLRLEMGFTPGLVAGEGYLTEGKPGGSLIATAGSVTVTGAEGDRISVGPCFARHTSTRRMGGALAPDEGRFTVYLTDFTPGEREIVFSVC